ncbi:hypothetical protein [Georgenia subflava]|uniref:Uncharacterized protein n=1 Tax=Georgenia subflava TaxID=1622177 RepID=A0A6N7EEZ5_9MICO|nr:hypothetical protein [Georgenia subflava]MPV35941.1 hypothetical protein [Georgenia subflava]
MKATGVTPQPNAVFPEVEELRLLLIRLHRRPELWRSDPAALGLLEHCRIKYAPLARRFGQRPEDARRVAFELLRAFGTRWGNDPWGSLTRGMRIALMTAQFEDALLCGRNQASHLLTSRSLRDVARFGEHEHLQRHVENTLALNPANNDEAARHTEATAAFVAVEKIVGDAISVLAACGWPARVAEHAIGLIAARLIETGNRRRAHENLRHDRQTAHMLGLEHGSWCALLTAVLGTPDLKWEHTASGHGLLRRVAGGMPADEVLLDVRLVATLVAAAPEHDNPTPRSHEHAHGRKVAAHA